MERDLSPPAARCQVDRRPPANDPELAFAPVRRKPLIGEGLYSPKTAFSSRNNITNGIEELVERIEEEIGKGT
jgi:hypothetical protein